MEKKLLILGILRDHEMHGYQLSEVFGHRMFVPIKLSKANAYKLLNKMEQDGWVSYRDEQEGNRPPRRVYAITVEGEIAFQKMLRSSFAGYSTPEFPGSVAFNYLDKLSIDETVSLLEERREKVTALFSEVNEIPSEMRESHLSIEYLLRFYRSEIEWLDEINGHLRDS